MADGNTTRTTDLAWFVQAVGEDEDYAATCKTEAAQMVSDFIGEGNPYGVPEPVVERAVLEVGADLFYRKTSRNGVAALDGGGMEAPQVYRLNRDPMAAAYPLLRQYLVMGL